MERPALLSKTVKAGTVSDTLQLGHASLIFKHGQRLRDAAGLAERSARHRKPGVSLRKKASSMVPGSCSIHGTSGMLLRLKHIITGRAGFSPHQKHRDRWVY
jgi:hypothetical protein